MFDQAMILQQLRCCGVLEVVRIAKAGYPTRYLHKRFVQVRCLCSCERCGVASRTGTSCISRCMLVHAQEVFGCALCLLHNDWKHAKGRMHRLLPRELLAHSTVKVQLTDCSNSLC